MPFKKGDPNINREGRTVKGAGKTKYNRLTNEQRKALADQTGGITSLQLLRSIIRAEDAPLGIKLEAIKISMPYEHRKMPQQIEGTGPGGAIVMLDATVLAKMSEKELKEYRQRLTALKVLKSLQDAVGREDET